MKRSAQKNLSLIPSVHRVAELIISADFSREMLVTIIRQEILRLKKSKSVWHSREEAENVVIRKVKERLESLKGRSLRRVINATGVILHTGLGRAPFSAKAREQLRETIEGYCNVELDLESGERGERTDHVEELLCLLTGSEAAAVVNNNAAAVLLLLNTLAYQKEVVVSRGELVEIGGSFRIPDVMEKSGAVMREVGTTNKTHLKDFEKAVSGKTGLLLAVHTSNYRILGFTAKVGLEELCRLGKRKKLPVAYDLGGGALVDLAQFGLPHEPVVSESLESGADIVTFSADKIMGACQAGILVGKKRYLDAIKKNPLMRALRCDKMTYAVLEATLKQYLEPGAKPFPVIRMLTEEVKNIRSRAETIVSSCEGIPGLRMTIKESHAEAGSGTLPLEKIPSIGITVSCDRCSANELAAKFRKLAIPVIGFVKDRAFHLDMRTVSGDEAVLIAEGIKKIMTE